MTNNPIMSSYIAYLEGLRKQKEELADYVVEKRDYYDGKHKSKLTATQAEMLNLQEETPIVVNICPTIVESTNERLKVQSVNLTDKKLSTYNDEVARWLETSRLDATATQVHRAALRDRESFAMIDYDTENAMPRVTAQYTFDGESGIEPHYINDNSQKPLFVTKQWVEEAWYTSDGQRHTRMVVYYPDHIEYWIRKDTRGWQPYLGDDTPGAALVDDMEYAGRKYQASVFWWTDTGQRGGEALGIPFIVFRNADDGSSYGVSELNDIVPGIQEAINKAHVDVMLAADLAGFPLLTLSGDEPPRDEDGKPVMPTVGPGALLYSNKQGAAWGYIPAGDLRQLLEVRDSHVNTAAKLSKVPLSQFQVTGAIAAENTLKQQESGLNSKVGDRKITFGNGWEDAVKMMIIVDRIYNPVSKFRAFTLQQIRTLTLECVWRDMTPRSEEDRRAAAKEKRDLGLPPEEWLKELGYGAEEVSFLADLIRADEVEKLRVASMAFAGATGANAAQQNQQQNNGSQPNNGNQQFNEGN